MAWAILVVLKVLAACLVAFSAYPASWAFLAFLKASSASGAFLAGPSRPYREAVASGAFLKHVKKKTREWEIYFLGKVCGLGWGVGLRVICGAEH